MNYIDGNWCKKLRIRRPGDHQKAKSKLERSQYSVRWPLSSLPTRVTTAELEFLQVSDNLKQPKFDEIKSLVLARFSTAPRLALVQMRRSSAARKTFCGQRKEAFREVLLILWETRGKFFCLLPLDRHPWLRARGPWSQGIRQIFFRVNYSFNLVRGRNQVRFFFFQCKIQGIATWSSLNEPTTFLITRN